ncbi:MAG: hypothetical protein K2Y25_08025 [Pseudomonadaceae bacterium]|jgi:hypothetical protein|nr:hypothetical protein [Pseudomonadaceae bacterium]
MIRALLVSCCLLLGACAGHTPVPPTAPELAVGLPLTLHIQRQQAAEQRDWLLVLQAEGPSLRWSLLDPLGVPLARQLLTAGAWHNDGLLPPNPEARELFAVLLFALSSEAGLEHNYQPGDWQTTAQGRWLVPDWTIDYRTAVDFSISGAAGLRYQVRALSGQGER